MIKISELSEEAQKDFEKIMKLRNKKNFFEITEGVIGTPRSRALIFHPEIGAAIANEIRKQRSKCI